MLPSARADTCESPSQVAIAWSITTVEAIIAVPATEAPYSRTTRRSWPWVPPHCGRSGMPRPANDMRGAAAGFEVPKDFRIPEPLRPWA